MCYKVFMKNAMCRRMSVIGTYASIAGIAYSPVLVNMAPLAPGSAFTMKLCGIPLLIRTGLGPSTLLS